MLENNLETLLIEVTHIKEIVTKLMNSMNADTNTNEFLNSNEASLYLDISKSHFYKLTMEKTIPYYKPNGKKMYFKKSDLDTFMNSKKSKSMNDLELEANKYISKQIN